MFDTINGNWCNLHSQHGASWCKRPSGRRRTREEGENTSALDDRVDECMNQVAPAEASLNTLLTQVVNTGPSKVKGKGERKEKKNRQEEKDQQIISDCQLNRLILHHFILLLRCYISQSNQVDWWSSKSRKYFVLDVKVRYQNYISGKKVLKLMLLPHITTVASVHG